MLVSLLLALLAILALGALFFAFFYAIIVVLLSEVFPFLISWGGSRAVLHQYARLIMDPGLYVVGGASLFLGLICYLSLRQKYRKVPDKVLKGTHTLEGRRARSMARKLTRKHDGVSLHDSYTMSQTQEKNHTLIVAGTGGGKGIILTRLLSLLFFEGRKTLAYDIKGDYCSTYAEEPGALILSPFDARSVAWDVSADLVTRMDAEEFAHLLVASSSAGGGDSIFPEAARDVISVVLFGLIQEKKQHGRLWGFRDLVAVLSDEKATTEYCRKYDPGALQSIPENAEKQRAGTFGTIRAACRMLKYLGDAWPDSSQASFSVLRWLQDPEEALLLLQGSPRYEGLSAFFVSLVYAIAGGKILSLNDDPRRDLWFLIDEMGTLPKMRSLLSMLKLGRSRGLRIVGAIQDFGSINAKYGKEAETVLGNFGTQLGGRVNDPATAQWLSELFGKRQVERIIISKNHGKNSSVGRSTHTSSEAMSTHVITEDALLDSHFSAIPQADPSRKVPAIMWVRTSGQPALRLEWMPIVVERSQPENVPASWIDT